MKAFAFDTETWLIQPGLSAPPMVCATVSDGANDRIFLREDGLDWLGENLKENFIVGQNIAYDLGVVSVARPRLLPLIFKALDEGRIYSTDIAEALNDNATETGMYPLFNGKPTRYSLVYLEQKYLGIDRSGEKENGWRLRYAELDGIPLAEWPKEAIEYPLRDARGTFKVYEAQRTHANLHVHPQEMRAAFALRLSTIFGLRTDPDFAEHVAKEITKYHNESRRKYFESGIVKIKACPKGDTPDDIDSNLLVELGNFTKKSDQPWAPARAKEIDALIKRPRPMRWAEDRKVKVARVVEAYGGDPSYTEKGNVQADKDALLESGDPLLESYAEDGANEKLFSSFLPVISNRAPINPNTFLTSTQRCSYNNPNLQQLPRASEVRMCFVPPPGWVFVSNDYSTLELCTLAEVQFIEFGKSVIGDSINEGQDLHLRLAARVLGLPYVLALLNKKRKDIKDMRQAMKAVNFGLPGMMGPPKLVLTARKTGVRFCELAHELDKCGSAGKVTTWADRAISPTCTVCLELAQKYSKIWKEEFDMGPYFELAKRNAGRCEKYGEPFRSYGTGMLRLEKSPGGASNHPFQNLAAQGAKHSLYLITREAYTDRSSVLFNNCRVGNFVHDENFLCVREEALHECAFRCAELMVQGMGEFVKHVKITTEPAAQRRWFKAAEKVFDKNGRLKPWWPERWDWPPDQETMKSDLER